MDEDYCDYGFDDGEYLAEHAAKKNFGFHDGPAESADALKELLEAHLPFDVDWRANPNRWDFDFTELQITLSNNDHITVTAQSDVLSRRRLDPIRQELRKVLADAFSDLTWNKMTFGVMLLQMVEEASWHIQEYQASLPSQRSDTGDKHRAGWDAYSAHNPDILYNPFGVNLSTVRDTALHLLGQPISEILKDIPEELRILHVEPVFRSDLVNKFLSRQERIKEELEKISISELRPCVNRADLQAGRVTNTKEGMVEHLSKPRVTFHGSPRSRISSIVRHGFIVPGHKIGSSDEMLEVRCGSTFGRGIYSSPSLSYASAYGQGQGFDGLHPGDVPGFRMIVCATLMGRPLQVTRDETQRTDGVFSERAHSHVSPSKLEYIVFDKAQMIPCYVLHIDYGSEAARKHLDDFRKNPNQHTGRKTKSRIQHAFQNEEMWPAAKKAKAEALKAAATKWFPYGYGSATGTTFKIEEIAEVSDDEEDYGEYQALRGEHDNEIKVWQQSGNDGASWFDEYQTARRGKP